jgi:3-oxoacyl-[acyl-carrier-protein] synthase III
MKNQNMRNATIHSTGIGLADRVLPNTYFDSLLGEPVSEWLEANVEIFERRWCGEKQEVSDLCRSAALEALSNGNLQPEDIDLLIVATDTPECISPATAANVQHICGMKNAAAFDLNAACAGFVSALITGANFIRGDAQFNNVMVIGAYKMSSFLNMLDKKTVTLFADGAGAVILQSTKEQSLGKLASRMISKGQYFEYMGIYGGGSRNPCLPSHDETLANNKLQFLKRFPPELNTEIWTKLAYELCDKAGLSPDNIDHYFFTQININSIRATLNKLNVSADKTTTIMHQYGYTGSACIPMAIHHAFKAGKIQSGNKIMIIGSGGGLAFSAALFQI